MSACSSNSCGCCAFVCLAPDTLQAFQLQCASAVQVAPTMMWMAQAPMQFAGMIPVGCDDGPKAISQQVSTAEVMSWGLPPYACTSSVCEGEVPVQFRMSALAAGGAVPCSRPLLEVTHGSRPAPVLPPLDSLGFKKGDDNDSDCDASSDVVRTPSPWPDTWPCDETQHFFFPSDDAACFSALGAAPFDDTHVSLAAPSLTSVTPSRNAFRRRQRNRADARVAAETEETAAATRTGGSATARLGDDDFASDIEMVASSGLGGANTDAVHVRELAKELLERFDAAAPDGPERQSALDAVAELSFADKDSCRVVQLALDGASARNAAALASSLHGRVWEAIESKFANYVLQRVVEVTPATCSAFVAAELLGFGVDVARHRFGCRILCRLLEHVGPADAEGPAAALINEIIFSASALVRHAYGGYVVRHVLEYGQASQRQRVAEAVRADAFRNAKNKQGSRAIDAVLRFCAPAERQALVDVFTREPELLIQTALNQCGCRTVHTLLALPAELRQKVVVALACGNDQLQASKHGRHVLTAMAASAKM